MSSGLYIGMTAASARAQQVEMLSDNLANAQTPGFVATRATFDAVLAGKTENDALIQDKMLTGRAGAVVDKTPGRRKQTGRRLDVALPQNHWLKVLRRDGQEAYPRNGSLQVDGQGRLLSAGNPVLSSRGGPIFVPPGARAEIASDGVVLVNGRAATQLGVFELSGAVERLGGTMVRPLQEGDGARIDTPRVFVGQLEESNAKALETTVELMTAQRAYDQALQAVQTTRDMDKGVMSVGRVR